MNRLLLGAALCALFTVPALAALKVGDTAPDFTAKASLGGKEFTFSLADALKKGPAVVYFYPSAYTGGCDLKPTRLRKAPTNSAAAGASIIGVSADNMERLNQFAADPAFCAGKFPIASDESLKVAGSYNLSTQAPREGAKDVRGVEIGHGFIERVTYVVGKDHKIIAVMSSKDDKLSPDQHVDKSLAIVARRQVILLLKATTPSGSQSAGRSILYPSRSSTKGRSPRARQRAGRGSGSQHGPRVCEERSFSTGNFF